MGYSQIILTSPLHQTLSNSTITLDQVLPARLENYMMVAIEQEQNLPKYISNLSLTEIFNQIQYDQILQYAKPLVIEQNDQKQYQIINLQSNRQIGFQQKKTDGLLSNQIFNSKINNTRSISPQPISAIFNKTQTDTQSQIPVVQAESQFKNDQFMNFNPNQSYLSSNSILNDTPLQYEFNKWSDKSKEKILFQDHFNVVEDATKQAKSNKIIINKSEDPQFFQQLKNARVASPKLRQIKGSGLSPETYHKNKSKSPEVLQVNLAHYCKKWEITQNTKQQQYQVQKKLPEQFKQLLTDSTKRQNISKPFDQNNTKFALIQCKSTAQMKNTKLPKLLEYLDSTTENQMNAIKSEKTLTPRIANQQDYINYNIQMMLSEQQSLPKSRSQNRKQDEILNENIQHQNFNFRDQFSFKPQFEQKYQEFEVKQEIPQQIQVQQVVESKSIRAISPSNRLIPQQFKQQSAIIQQPQVPSNQQKEPIQIQLDIKQFMNTNRPKDQQQYISSICSQRQQIGNLQIKVGMTNENGKSYFVNVNFRNE
ncbi:unnamed protein product (macronuclear) [Paramecium tetraurelia]|uniref:Uncharacterized protein n=1 Tax=Paramecium tetraurelia TaxID=5888 RepID=A0CAS6_PARTE|nr:uncharacterized protein GSPATT00036674001 [Paramecium tetraurelia]CAK67893.1 unnamed protein product [Paramecium tetraurelia]|eukprot:XP_001435290.1 hypothetical protein (macronuclear) [Paramecium tetraurelia strain d4-2]